MIPLLAEKIEKLEKRKQNGEHVGNPEAPRVLVAGYPRKEFNRMKPSLSPRMLIIGASDAGIGMGSGEAIYVDRTMATPVSDIWAAGDCVQTWHRILDRNVYMPLGTTAHKQGRVAGENMIGGKCEFQGSLGTQAVKVRKHRVQKSTRLW